MDMRLAFHLQQEPAQFRNIALRFQLHASVRQIFDPTGKIALFCKQTRGIAKADELNVALK